MKHHLTPLVLVVLIAISCRPRESETSDVSAAETKPAEAESPGRVWPHREATGPGGVAKLHEVKASQFLKSAWDLRRYKARRELETNADPAIASFRFRDGDSNIIVMKKGGVVQKRSDVLRFWPSVAHDYYLELFLDSPGFGMSRMYPPPPSREFHFTEVETGRNQTVRIASVQLLGLVIRPNPVVYLLGAPEPSPTFHLVLPKETHPLNATAAVRDISQSPLTNYTGLTLGVPKNAISVSSVRQPNADDRAADSLLRSSHAAARAQASRTSPEHYPTRPLSALEQDAVKLMRSGENFVWIEQQKQLSLLGSIRASQSCLECHSVREGELLGAFVYQVQVAFQDENTTPKTGGQ